MKHDLNPTYRALCSPKEEGEQLFGDNLNEKIRELNEVNHMGGSLNYRDRDYQYRGKCRGPRYPRPALYFANRGKYQSVAPRRQANSPS